MKKWYLIFFLIMFSSINSFAQDAWDHIGKGSFLEEKGFLKEAVKEYETAIEIDPKNAHVYISVGSIYENDLNKKDRAIEVYKKGLLNCPDDYALNLRMMNFYFDKDEIKKGLRQYEILSKIKPSKNHHAFRTEVLERVTRGIDDENKLKLNKKYLDLNEKDVVLRKALVKHYMYKKDYNSALAELNEYLNAGQKDVFFYRNLGSCYYVLGRKKDALCALKKARELGARLPQEVFDKLNSELKTQPVCK